MKEQKWRGPFRWDEIPFRNDPHVHYLIRDSTDKLVCRVADPEAAKILTDRLNYGEELHDAVTLAIIGMKNDSHHIRLKKSWKDTLAGLWDLVSGRRRREVILHTSTAEWEGWKT